MLPGLSAALLVILGGACSDDEDPVTLDASPIVPASDAAVVDSSPPDVMACNGEMELGTGARQFEPVKDGDTVYLYRGPQGGYMIYLGVRARGIDPSEATLCYVETFTSGPENGLVFGEGCWRIKLPIDLGDGRHERVGIWGEVDERYWAGLSFMIRGKDARMEATITDKHGCSASASWTTVHIFEELGR